MARLILIAFSFIVGQILKAQSLDSSHMSNQEIKSFFSEARHLINTGNKLLLSDKSYEAPSKDLLYKITAQDTLFTRIDVDFIIKQVNLSNNKLWDSSYIDSTVFIKSNDIDSIFKNFRIDSGWRVFHKNYGRGFYRMSMPYFSRNKQACIIYIGYHCGGLCGEGGFKIFRKQKGRWVYYKTFGRWVS